jgi:hypothetical protein
MHQIPAWMLNYRPIYPVGSDPRVRRDYAIREIAKRFTGYSVRLIAEIIMEQPRVLAEIAAAIAAPDPLGYESSERRRVPVSISAHIIRRALHRRPRYQPIAYMGRARRARAEGPAIPVIAPIESNEKYAAALRLLRELDQRYARITRKIRRLRGRPYTSSTKLLASGVLLERRPH